MKTLFAALAGMVLVLSTFTAHSATYYFHNDHLGTPQVVTDESQAVVWQGDYDPFGEATETVATVEQNLRFPGQYLDRESGLHYNYFRTYDPSIGRYTQSDPIGLGGGVSTYGYAYQNALRYTDPTGEVVPVVVWWAATALFTTFQAAGLVYDVYGTAATLADECSTTTEKVVAGVGLVASVGFPIKGVSSLLKSVPKSGKPDFVVTKDGTAVPVSQSRMREGFDDAGFPRSTSKITDETAITHTVSTPKGPIDVRTMEGGANHPRRAVFSTPGQSKSPRTAGGGTPQGTKQQQRAASHLEQSP